MKNGEQLGKELLELTAKLKERQQRPNKTTWKHIVAGTWDVIAGILSFLGGCLFVLLYNVRIEGVRIVDETEVGITGIFL